MENNPGKTPGDARKVVQLDPRNLRGLAHPLRIRLLGALREFGPATASGLGQRLGESSGATSYHLRQLAEYGFVEEEHGRGTARERWWRAAHDSTRLEGAERFTRDPETRGAWDLFLHELATIHTQQLSTAIGEMHLLSPEWVESSTISDFRLRLTAEESGAMLREVEAVLERYRRPGDDPGPEGAEQVMVHLHAFPRTRPAERGERGEPADRDG